MIAWWWLIPAAMIGGMVGLFTAALCAAAARGEIHIPPGQKL